MDTRSDRCTVGRRVSLFYSLLLLAIPAAHAADAPGTSPRQQLPSSKVAHSDSVMRRQREYRVSPREVGTLLAEEHDPPNQRERTTQLNEVVVAQQIQRLPMHSVDAAIWPGLGALAWAIDNPTATWRIFLPIAPT
jgi:hypothetical protein